MVLFCHVSVLTLMLALVEVAFCQRLSSSGYIAYPAVLKQATIWHNVIFNQTSGPWLPKNLSESELPPAIKNADPCPTLEAPGDELPDGRVKINRAVGSVGKVKFVPIGRRQNPYYHRGRQNPYTGIFQGASFGIVRISTALEPMPDCNNCTDPIFGMGLKFLRDGVESASLVAIKSAAGQKSWNVFKHSWSNHFPMPANIRPIHIELGMFLAGASPHSAQVGLSDVARYGEKGRLISDSEINYPYKLVFRPTGEIMFPDEYHGDLADDLATIEKDTVLWDVLAWDNPEELGGREELIGSLILTSPLVPSLWGDTKLFFRHQDMRDDFRLRPEWEEFTSKTTDGFRRLGIEITQKCTKDI